MVKIKGRSGMEHEFQGLDYTQEGLYVVDFYSRIKEEIPKPTEESPIIAFIIKMYDVGAKYGTLRVPKYLVEKAEKIVRDAPYRIKIEIEEER
ncbi:MAG: hypothetical protein ACP5H3_01495 [Candidatus Aenigmatarchaeota archaeon]